MQKSAFVRQVRVAREAPEDMNKPGTMNVPHASGVAKIPTAQHIDRGEDLDTVLTATSRNNPPRSTASITSQLFRIYNQHCLAARSINGIVISHKATMRQ